MSTRLIRKLKKLEKPSNEKAANVENEVDEQEDDDDDDEIVTTQKFIGNKFDLLEAEDLSDHQENDSQPEQTELPKEDKKPKKIKNKKKAKKGNKTNDDDTSNCDEYKFVSDFDSLDLNKYLTDDDPNSTQQITNSIDRELLKIETKHLNSEYEMVRKFGAKVVHTDKQQLLKGSNKRGNNNLTTKLSRFNTIVVKRPTWPPYYRNGLQMTLLGNQNSDVLEFTFEHLKEYQQIQFNFLDAVDSLDHNHIINVLHTSPYHIDSLIQLSDVSRLSDDTQMAADLIERALYTFQSSFHPSFNLQKNNFKFNYCRIENRGFFICLFKHMLYTSSKACYRTALELCKLLLSLDFETDPLGCILIIDFLALRSCQYKYLIDFFKTYENKKYLSLLPNFSYSIALAYYNLYRDTNDVAYETEANNLLQLTLVRFPSLLLELLDKCGVQPDKSVEKHWIFAKTSHLGQPTGLKCLVDLYASRMCHEWKIPEVIKWLESNVNKIINNENSHVKKIKDYKAQFKGLFVKAPPNVLRHIFLCDSKEVPLSLPHEYHATAIYTFDPIPPENSVVTYKRPDRPKTVAAYANEASLFTFFRSMLPTFNSEERIPEETAAAAANTRQQQGLATEILSQLRNLLTDLQGRIDANNANNEPILQEVDPNDIDPNQQRNFTDDSDIEEID